MIKIMFVCHGNIFRSPMAEFIMKKLVKDADIQDNFYIASSQQVPKKSGMVREILSTLLLMQN